MVIGLGNLPLVLLAGAFSILGPGLALAWLSRGRHPVRTSLPLVHGATDEDVVFLVDGQTLIDATEAARDLLDPPVIGGSDLDRIDRALSPTYPEVSSILRGDDDFAPRDLPAPRSRDCLRLQRRSGILRIAVIRRLDDGGTIRIEASRHRETEAELQTLRAIAEETPFLVWRQTAGGKVTWANRAYLSAVSRFREDGAPPIWPPPAMFEPKALSPAGGNGGPRRLPLHCDVTGRDKWFEIHAAPIGDETLFSAVDIDQTVHAETQLREFMQTLTKTFAHLKIGLAVFDRSRRLALFNPALTDLTTLPVDFLSARPTLVGFLDRLRDLRMIPEPKDYKSWRRQLAELEAAAMNGSYSETWSLPSGQTYRVTGRPHPGGAVAFLVENISAEVSLTRRFRSELEMGQAVVDSFDEAIAVFSRDGTLSMTNARYEQLWHSQETGPLERVSIIEATRLCMSRCVPSPIWGDIRDFATQGPDRTEWTARVGMADGRVLNCRVTPLLGGLTLVGFQDIRTGGELTFVQAKSA